MLALVSASEEYILVPYTNRNGIKKGIEMESKIKCDLDIILQK